MVEGWIKALVPEDSEDATLLHVGKLGLRGEKLKALPSRSVSGADRSWDLDSIEGLGGPGCTQGLGTIPALGLLQTMLLSKLLEELNSGSPNLPDV